MTPSRSGHQDAAAGSPRRRLYVYNGGFLTQHRIRRILDLAGYDVAVGKPSSGDFIGVWGNSPTSHRGGKVADLTKAPVVRVEDSFLRSIRPGRDGEPPLGLQIDHSGVHFDPSRPSDLEKLLADHPLDDFALLSRAKLASARLKRLHLSKYNAFDPTIEPPAPGYVLVIDQTKGDAAVKASRADANTFREMLYYAQEEHPGKRILIKTHPDTQAGHRQGYFSQEDCSDRISLCDTALSPFALMEGAVAVYTVSSQLGFEAIMAGHRPVVFGQPFYIGWSLTDDRAPLDRRQRNLTKAQLFAAAMILHPTWYDPYRDQLCALEHVIDTLEAQANAWRADHDGWAAYGMRLWKRKPMQAVFGSVRPVVFPKDKAARTDGRRAMVWANKADQAPPNAVKVEDGFLRSRGLGAELIPPLSLVCDDLGMYYDPTRPSLLEECIAGSLNLSDDARDRAQRLLKTLIENGVSKYNLGRSAPTADLPPGRCILVPGQVEDDASLRLGAGEINTNRALLKATRAANPAAILIYKPHPDVEAGLREGSLPEAKNWADEIWNDADPIAAIDAVDSVWTMTSLLGFEALIRGKDVTCTGMPFYAGWGLTDDRGAPCPRRSARPDLIGLIYAVLIAYPRYFDPKTGLACPVEVAVERLRTGDIPTAGPVNRVIAKLQGAFASYAYLWR